MRTQPSGVTVDQGIGDPEQILIKTFGGLALFYLDFPITILWESQKARILFCYLLISYDQWLHRDKLIEMLWPGCDPVSGAKNFKTTLSRLRKSFAGPRSINPIITLGEAIRLDSSIFALDSSRFKLYAQNGIKMLARGDIPAARKYLEAAQDVHSGTFLPEEPFDDQICAERAELERLHESALNSLQKVYQLEGNNDAVEAISFLKPVHSNN